MLDLNSGTPWETVMLTTLSRDRDLFASLLAEARVLAQNAQVGRTVIYTAWGAEWRPFGRPRARRLLESVVLDDGVKERIVSDVKNFMVRGKWYSERGEFVAVCSNTLEAILSPFVEYRRDTLPTRLSSVWPARFGQV